MASADALDLIAYAGLWASFALGHSLLASHRVRRAVIRLAGSAERLLYNLVAVLHLALVLLIGRALLATAPPFPLPQWVDGLLMLIGVLGALGLIIVLSSYDLGRFSGLTQWRLGRADNLAAAEEPLITSGLHQHIRHPLYSAAIIALWGGAATPFGLATAVFGTAYLLIGLRFEERKLIAVHGDAYLAYRQQVPALVPRFSRRP